MAESRNFKVRTEQAGHALATVLKHALNDKSWGEVKRLIAKRHVQVNGNLSIDPGRRLKAGEVISFWENSRPRPPDEQNIVIRYRDDHILVIEKPAMMTTLRHSEEDDWDDKRKSMQPTLVEALQKLIDRTPALGQARMDRGGHPLRGKRSPSGSTRPMGKIPLRFKVRPVHRLDRDTSGLMVFALSTPAEQKLTSMFAGHELERVYTAFALGDVKEQKIESKLVRDRGDGLRGSAVGETTDPSARTAVTHVKPVRTIGPYSQVECRLETGRTHQIRIHLSEIGHMLCGERMYNRTRTGQHVRDPSGAPRQALHAGRLSFDHPITGEHMDFAMDLPSDLGDWLHTLEEKVRHQARRDAQKKSTEPGEPAKPENGDSRE